MGHTIRLNSQANDTAIRLGQLFTSIIMSEAATLRQLSTDVSGPVGSKEFFITDSMGRIDCAMSASVQDERTIRVDISAMAGTDPLLPRFAETVRTQLSSLPCLTGWQVEQDGSISFTISL